MAKIVIQSGFSSVKCGLHDQRKAVMKKGELLAAASHIFNVEEQRQVRESFIDHLQLCATRPSYRSNMVQNEWESVPKVVLGLLHLVQGLLHLVQHTTYHVGVPCRQRRRRTRRRCPPRRWCLCGRARNRRFPLLLFPRSRSHCLGLRRFRCP